MLGKYQPFVLRHALVLGVGSNHLLRVLGLYVQPQLVQHIAGDGEQKNYFIAVCIISTAQLELSDKIIRSTPTVCRV
jgi:hypothetical protein